jgi:GGDEF domain-containing protein
MKNKLKTITDNTINDLLQNDIILPSTYFQTFDRHAKTLKTNMEDESFIQEVNEMITQEFSHINSYMTQTINNIQKLSSATQTAQTAIANRDENELTKVYQEIQELQNEVCSLQNEMYRDSLTHTKNKKWIYAEFITEEGLTKKEGLIALLEIKDFEHIETEHGNLIADNLLKFFSDFVNDKIADEGVEFDLTRYVKDKFLLFIYNESMKETFTLLKNIQKSLLNTTLKSKSGILIQTTYEYQLASFLKEENFQNLLEKLSRKTPL